MKILYCLHCKKEYKVKPYQLSISKFCSSFCYHSNAKGKPLSGERLKIAQQTILKTINIRQNNPKIKEKWLLKMKECTVGPKSCHWIKDRSKVSNQDGRNGYEDIKWKKSVYQRDLYKCRISNNDCKGKIEAHHILSWRDYPELRYQINNGITLCHAHHPRIRAEEKRLSPYFQEIVSVSK